MLIAAAADTIDRAGRNDPKPRVLTFRPDNLVDEVLRYDAFKSDKRTFDFPILADEDGGS